MNSSLNPSHIDIVFTETLQRFVVYVPRELHTYLFADELVVCSAVCRAWRRALLSQWRDRLRCFDLPNLPSNPFLASALRMFSARALEAPVGAVSPLPEVCGAPENENEQEDVVVNWANPAEPVRWLFKDIKRHHKELVCVGHYVVNKSKEEGIVFVHSLGHTPMYPPTTFVMTMRATGPTDNQPAMTWRIAPRDYTVDAHTASEVLLGHPTRTMCEVHTTSGPVGAGDTFLSVLEHFLVAPMVNAEDPRGVLAQWANARSGASQLKGTVTAQAAMMEVYIQRHFDTRQPLYLLRVLDHQIETAKGTASYTNNECEATRAAKDATCSRHIKKVHQVKAFVDRHAEGIVASLQRIFPTGLVHSLSPY